MFIEDDKLPLDVLRKSYGDSHHALCCLECGYEAEFDPPWQVRLVGISPFCFTIPAKGTILRKWVGEI
jgi:hypothetical protein